MKFAKVIKVRYLVLLTMGTANVFLFQNCSNYAGQVSMTDNRMKVGDDANIPSQFIAITAPGNNSEISGADQNSGSETATTDNTTANQAPQGSDMNTTAPQTASQDSMTSTTAPQTTAQDSMTSTTAPQTASQDSMTNTTTPQTTAQDSMTNTATPTTVAQEPPKKTSPLQTEIAKTNQSTSGASQALPVAYQSPEPFPEILKSISERPDGCDNQVAKKTCQEAKVEIAGSCDDDGNDASSDQDDLNICTTLLDKAKKTATDLNGQSSFSFKGKKILKTRSALGTITGHGKLVLIYDGKAGKGVIDSIDGFKGKVILCGFEVKKMKAVRGKVVLVNTNIHKLEYRRSRVIAVDTSSSHTGGALKVSVLNGGKKNAGIWTAVNGYISSQSVVGEAGLRELSEPNIKAKIQLREEHEKLKKEHRDAIQEMTLTISKQRGTPTYEKNKNRMEKALESMKGASLSLEKDKIEVTPDDDDLSCREDRNKEEEIRELKVRNESKFEGGRNDLKIAKEQFGKEQEKASKASTC